MPNGPQAEACGSDRVAGNTQNGGLTRDKQSRGLQPTGLLDEREPPFTPHRLARGLKPTALTASYHERVPS